MREETFFEHCLRRLRAGDEDTDLKDLVDQAEEYYQSELIKEKILSNSESKELKKIDYSSRSKKAWDTRRRRQEQKELEAKKLVYPQ